MQCTNNLKQMGLAVHNFHDAIGGIPPVNPVWHRITTFGFLYPFAEQTILYQRLYAHDDPITLGSYLWNSNGWWVGHLNDTEKKGFASVPYMVCPSRRSGPAAIEYVSGEGSGGSTSGPCTDYCLIASTDGNVALNGRASASDYHWHAHVYAFMTNNTNAQNVQRGFFRGAVIPKWGDWKNYKCRDTFARVVDGLSNQIIIGEKHIPIDGLGVCNATNPAAESYAKCHDCSYLSGIANSDAASLIRTVCNYWSNDGKTPYLGMVNNGFGGPYDYLVRNNVAAINTNLGSWHAGGVNVLKADGSVSFLSATTAQAIVGKLATVDDGNTVEN